MTTATHEGTLFAMPSLGADMTEGRITEWLVQPGDHVERGQIVVIVETDKSDIEVEVFEPATVAELLVGEGDLVPVGAPIARFDGAVSGTVAHETVPPPRAATSTTVHVEAALPSETPNPTANQVTSPMIRHLADELHVDTNRIRGTGPGGRVHRDDVEAAAGEPNRRRITPRARRLMSERGIDPGRFATLGYVTGDDVLELPIESDGSRDAEPSHDRPTKAETMRRHIADLMSRSWAEIPHFHLARRLDLRLMSDRLTEANGQRAIADRVVPGALLLCAAAQAAAKVPACNGWWRDGGFQPADEVRLGVVLSLRSGGILVPTIDQADGLTSVEMMQRLAELVQRARQGRLRASDMGEATITVTNLGDLGADSVAGVIHPPQVALVGFGAVHDAVVASDGLPTVHPTVDASLAGDHRAIDGLTGSRYLAQLQTLLDGPLLEELQ